MTARVNLAPEVYQSSQRNKRRRQLATTIGIGIAVVCGALIILGLVIMGAQAVYIGSLQNSINDSEQRLKTYPDLQAAVTVQKHLNSWVSLYDQKVYVSKFFQVLEEFEPQGVAASQLELKEGNILELNATAKNYQLVNKFAKALEASNVEIGSSASPNKQPYFGDVELSAVSSNNQSIEFTLTTQVSNEVTRGR